MSWATVSPGLEMRDDSSYFTELPKVTLLKIPTKILENLTKYQIYFYYINCDNCHTTFDKGLLKTSSLFEEVVQTIFVEFAQ